MDLTQMLIDRGVLQEESIIQAFNNVDRRSFLPDSQKDKYLENKPLPIGFNQTNSQPFTVAFMLELLLPEPGDKVLDVGSGSGWTSALIAQIVGDDGFVYGVEKIPELVEQANKNLSASGISNADVVQAEDRIGLPGKSPFNKIIVSASAEELPQELLDQLGASGRLVIPIKESIWVYEKVDGKIKSHDFPGFIFVPLVA